jgi:glycosyltransferase involved in cell wall biosynthesis
MFVSIIIPVYNSQNTIEYCLKSCFSQIDLIKEIILIDDHSLDNTVNTIMNFQREFPDKIKLYTNIGKGSNSARNYGFTKATGRFIQWLDADDELGDKKLVYQVDFLLREEKYDIAYSDWYLKTIGEIGHEIIQFNKEKQSDDFLYKLLIDDWLPPHAYLLNYEAAERITKRLGWNSQTQVLQDREYFTIAAILGLKFGYVSKAYSIYYRYTKRTSVSKVSGEARYKSLFFIIQRWRFVLSDIEHNWTQRHFDLINSLELLCRVELKKQVKWSVVDVFRIEWRVFPGKKSILLTLLKLLIYFPRRSENELPIKN